MFNLKGPFVWPSLTHHSPFLHSRFCLFRLPWLEITRAFSLQSLPWLTCEKWIKPDLPWSDMKTEWPAMVHLVSKLAASNEANTCLKSLEWGKNQRKDVRNSTSYKSFESLAGVKICALKPKYMAPCIVLYCIVSYRIVLYCMYVCMYVYIYIYIDMCIYII